MGSERIHLSKTVASMVSERVLIRRNSYKVVRDLNICLLETSSNDSFSNKHSFGLALHELN